MSRGDKAGGILGSHCVQLALVWIRGFLLDNESHACYILGPVAQSFAFGEHVMSNNPQPI